MKVVTGGPRGYVTYITSRNGSASFSVMTIERTDITVNVQHCGSATKTENLVERCEIVATTVVERLMPGIKSD